MPNENHPRKLTRKMVKVLNWTTTCIRSPVDREVLAKDDGDVNDVNDHC